MPLFRCTCLQAVSSAPSRSAAPADLGQTWQSLDRLSEQFQSRLPHLGAGLLLLFAFWVLGKLLQRTAHAAGARTRIDPQLADVFGSLAVAVLTLIGILAMAVLIFPSFRPGDVVKGLGITSVAVGFAFKDILQNFFAGVLILLRKPFVVGDQIRVKEFEGTVEEINTRSTRLKTYDGERVVIPNGDVYTSSILVRTHYKIRRTRIVVGIGYPDSIAEARRVITAALGGVDGVLSDPGPWVYVEELAPSSVNFTVYFWTGSEQANVLAVRNRAVESIKTALDDAGIDMPYPHTVLLYHDQTGSRDGDRASNGDDSRELARTTPASPRG